MPAIDAATVLATATSRGYQKLSRRGIAECLAAAAPGSGGTPFVDPTPNWVTRVVANGGATPSAGTQAAMSTFANALNTAGIYNLMISVCCFVPDNLIAAITPLIKVAGNDPWTNNNFVVGDLSVNGMTGNSNNKYLDSGVVASTVFPTTYAGISIYSMTDGSQSAYEAGAIVITGDFTMAFNNIGYMSYSCWELGSATVIAANTGFIGFASGNRTSAASAELYQASSTVPFSKVGTAGAVTGTIPNNNTYVFCARNSGAASYFSGKQLSFVAIHLGLTSSQCQSLYNAVQALRVALGGGYV